MRHEVGTHPWRFDLRSATKDWRAVMDSAPSGFAQDDGDMALRVRLYSDKFERRSIIAWNDWAGDQRGS